MHKFAALVGIDWADSKHDVCLFDTSSRTKEFSILIHSPEAIASWANSLSARFPSQKIAVCLEQSRGPLLSALLKYDFLLLYPVNPSSVFNFRQAFFPSRAKDDPKDAELQVELLLHHLDRLRPFSPDDEITRTLQFLVEHRRRLVSDRTRLNNRLKALLKCFFPQLLTWFPDLATHLVCDFLLRWPTLDCAKKARKSALRSFFLSHHSTRKQLIESRIASIKESVELTTDRAVINSSIPMVKALASQMKSTLEAIREFDRQIEAHCARHEDYPLFSSLPGSGSVYSSRLLAALGSNRDRFTSADHLARLTGIAPVIERSGKTNWVHWRMFCPKFLRQSFHEYAGESIRHSIWAKAYYQSQRQRGKTHPAAVRALAFKWIRIIWKCWQTRTEYDEAVYVESLKRRNSPLMKYIEEASQQQADKKS
jgi:transposase